jgi:hypothetical protein
MLCKAKRFHRFRIQYSAKVAQIHPAYSRAFQFSRLFAVHCKWIQRFSAPLSIAFHSTHEIWPGRSRTTSRLSPSFTWRRSSAWTAAVGHPSGVQEVTAIFQAHEIAGLSGPAPLRQQLRPYVDIGATLVGVIGGYWSHRCAAASHAGSSSWLGSHSSRVWLVVAFRLAPCHHNPHDRF